MTGRHGGLLLVSRVAYDWGNPLWGTMTAPRAMAQGEETRALRLGQSSVGDNDMDDQLFVGCVISNLRLGQSSVGDNDFWWYFIVFFTPSCTYDWGNPLWGTMTSIKNNGGFPCIALTTGAILCGGQ